MSIEPRSQIGKIYPQNTPNNGREIGTGPTKEFKELYEILFNTQKSTLLVRSLTTKKWFAMEWATIITLAILAGIDKKGD